MPEIAVDISSLEGGSFEPLTEGTHLAEIQSATYQAAKNEGRFPQMKVTYAVIEGPDEGKSQSQWVTLPDPTINREFKAGGRLKAFFGKFGLTEGGLHFHDETDEFDGMVVDGQLEPFDMQGIRVIIRSFKNGKKQGTTEDRWDISLEEVVDDLTVGQAAAPAAATAEAAPAQAATAVASRPRAAAARPGERRSLR